MATLIRLRSPSGVTKVVDPAEFDVPKALAKGFTRAGDVMVAAHFRAMPTRRQREKFTPAELQDSGATQPQFVPDAVTEPGAVSALPAVFGGLGGAAGFAAGGGGATLASIASGGTLAPTIPPAAIGLGGVGAMAGGTTGQALRLAIDKALGVDVPSGPAEVAGSLAREGGLQGAYQLAGEPVVAGARLLGKAAMGAALRATPEAAQTAIREGITATAAGVRKILSRLGDYGAQMRRLAAVSTSQGVAHQPTDVIANALTTDFRGQPSLEKVIAGNQTGDQQAIKDQVLGYITDLFKRHGGSVPQPGTFIGGKPITPLNLLALKQQAQKIAQPIFDQLANKETAAMVSPADRVKATTYRAIRDAADEMLGQSLPTAVVNGRQVGYAELNKAESDLIQLKQILAPDTRSQMSVGAQIARRAVPSAAGAAVGGTAGALSDATGNRKTSAIGGATAGAMLMNSPQALSTLALMLNNPMLLSLLSQTPRAAGYAVSGAPR